MALDLSKMGERKQTVLNLKKQKGLEGQVAQVVLALDYSWSMSTLYSNGKIQELLERILPVGLGFDDNGEIEFYLFETGCLKLPENITLKNIDGYVNNKIIGKYQMGGTNYEPVLSKIYRDFVPESGGWFSSKSPKQMETPVFVIFITDGENSDYEHTREIIRKTSKAGMFIQFVGIGNESFRFLRELDDLSGREIDNTNFFSVNDLSKISDDDLYSRLMNEYPSWVQQAKQQNLIK